MLKEHEMILKVMEEEGRPLLAKDIARLIYSRFNGYKLPKFKVRNHLWDKKTLGPIINYDKDNYKYELQENIEFHKQMMFNDDCIYNFQIEKIYNHKINGNFIDYQVVGEKVLIQHSLELENIDKILIGIIRTELELGDKSKSTFRKLKMNIIKALDE